MLKATLIAVIVQLLYSFCESLAYRAVGHGTAADLRFSELGKDGLVPLLFFAVATGCLAVLFPLKRRLLVIAAITGALIGMLSLRSQLSGIETDRLLYLSITPITIGFRMALTSYCVFVIASAVRSPKQDLRRIIGNESTDSILRAAL